MDTGVLPGVNTDTWKYFDTKIITASKSGSPTAVSQGTGEIRYGRYIRVGKFVMVQIQLGFGTSPTRGAGDAYLMRLPVPVKRMVQEDVTAPQIIGIGYNYHAVTGNAYNQPLIATLSDKYESNANNENHYAQFFIGGYGLQFGTGSITGASKSTTITHNMPYAPNASDITISWSAFAGTRDVGHWWISNITSTTFDVNIRDTLG